MTRSTLRLSEAARLLVVPEGIVTSVFPRVERRLSTVGVEFDLWQQGFGAVALGCREDGKYAATIGGVVASIPRQVGKTFTVGHLLIGLALEFPGTRIVWTSHHGRTTTNTFRSMQGMVARRKVRPLLAPNGIRVANGEQEIRFANGSIIMFGAREHGFGRGLDAIDVEVFDEAQILSLKALEDMVPATNQARHPHGALVFFIGTPPRPSDDGEAFAAKRTAAIDGRTTDQVYVEFSADPDAALDDRSQWPVMNPSFPFRTPLESMLRMRENIPDDGSWRREAMGVWDELATAEPLVIDPDRWRALEVAEAPDGVPVFGVKFSPDGATVALAGAVCPERGPIYAEGIEHRLLVDGTRWLVEFLADRKATVVIDGKSGAGALEAALRQAGVPAHRIHRPTVDQVIAAHAAFVDAVTSAVLAVPPDPVLSSTATSVVRRPIGKSGGWGFAGRDGVDVTLVESVVLAHWLASTKRKRPGRRSGGRRAVIPG